jgi:LemA protein
MKKLAIAIGGLVVIIAVLLLVLGLPGGSYSRLVRLQQEGETQWAKLQNTYERRADRLAPNVVAMASAITNLDKSSLTELASARAALGRVNLNSAPTDPATLAAFDQAQEQLSAAIRRLLKLCENDPQLQATRRFEDLQTQVEGTESLINAEQRNFDKAAVAYDAAIDAYPAKLYARILGFKRLASFPSKTGGEER